VDPAQIPELWRDAIPERPTWPLHGMSDSMIATAMQGYLVDRPQDVKLGPIVRRLTEGSILYPNELLALSLVQSNIGRRPVVWSVTTGSGFAGLRDYLIQRGLGFELQTGVPDTTNPDLDLRRLAGAPLDLPATEQLVFDTYRYAGLLGRGATELDPTSASAAASLSLPLVQLAYAYHARGDRERLERAVRHGVQVSPNPALRAALQELLLAPPDTALPQAPE
jgi:hypothetical protein